LSEPETPRGPRLKRRPYIAWWNVVLGILAFLGYIWRGVDVWSNLDFINQKSGLFWEAVHFLFATQTGANVISIVFFALFIGSLLFQFERPSPTLLDSPQPPALSEPADSSLIASPVAQQIEKPNLVFKERERGFVHSKYGGVLEEGRNEDQYNFDPDNVGLLLPVENEFSDQFKTIPVSAITAQLLYKGTVNSFRVNRGAWLGGGNRTWFRVNDIERLILVVVVPGRAANDALVVALHKEYQQDSFNHFEKLVRILDEDYYRIQVKLISEKLGTVYAETELDLEITRDPIGVELTPRIDLTTDQIRQRLEGFLREGNDLLKNFPTQREGTDEDVKKIDVFENQVAKFLGRYPDRFSAATFLSDVPVVKFGGPGAHSSNWPSLNRLTTRIARIRDIIDEVRKA
jgi:hypothetical protein